MTYEEAVTLLKQGNETGFQYLYDTTYKSCLYVIGEIVKDSMEAEDILQDAYMNAISKIDTLKDPEKFPSWFRTMASHLAINRVNKNKRIQTVTPPMRMKLLNP